MKDNYNYGFDKNKPSKSGKRGSSSKYDDGSSYGGINVSEAEIKKEIQVIYSIFPKGSAVRKAAEQRARELFS